MSFRPTRCECCHKPNIPIKMVCAECFNLARDIRTALDPLYRKFESLNSLPLRKVVEKVIAKLL